MTGNGDFFSDYNVDDKDNNKNKDNHGKEKKKHDNHYKED